MQTMDNNTDNSIAIQAIGNDTDDNDAATDVDTATKTMR